MRDTMSIDKHEEGWQPFAAYALPFGLFMLGLVVEGLQAAKPYYPYVHGAKLLAVTLAIVWGWRYYPRFELRGMTLGLVLGVVGGIVWIVLCTWNFEQRVMPELVDALATWWNWPELRDWIKPASRMAYDPFTQLGQPGGWLFSVVRLYGLVLVVPVMEELFWRGFLNRWLQEDDWQRVPWGRFTRSSFTIVTLLFVLAHTEWTAALVWGLGINVVLIRTRNLWACVVAHAASNAVLGYYVLTYEQWRLW
jgi:membrane protease YdiL (CAAX protease family)